MAVVVALPGHSLSELVFKLAAMWPSVLRLRFRRRRPTRAQAQAVVRVTVPRACLGRASEQQPATEGALGLAKLAASGQPRGRVLRGRWRGAAPASAHWQAATVLVAIAGTVRRQVLQVQRPRSQEASPSLGAVNFVALALAWIEFSKT